MRKPVGQSLRLLQLQQGVDANWPKIYRRLSAVYPWVDLSCQADLSLLLQLDRLGIADQAARWCAEMLPGEHWCRTGTVFLFTTEEQKEWFKMRWVGEWRDDEEG